MENLDKLLGCIEHPENFSQEELYMLLAESETISLYNLLCASRGQAFVTDPLSEEEIANEWKKFKRRSVKRSFLTWVIRKKVVAVIILGVISCSLVALGISIRMTQSERNNTDSTVVKAMSEATTGCPSDIESTTFATNDTVITFEDEKLDVILNTISSYYNITIDLRSPHSKEVRLFFKWDSTTPIEEIIDHLNTFERINLILTETTLTDY